MWWFGTTTAARAFTPTCRLEISRSLRGQRSPLVSLLRCPTTQAAPAHRTFMLNAPNGEIFQKSSKVDPNACIGSDVVGGIQVRDNGQATDDAFTVSIGGRAICSTTIGASNSCSLGALRSGTASLSIRADIAPDQVGTYEITLSSGITFQGGGTRISGTLGEGESATFTIVIP